MMVSGNLNIGDKIVMDQVIYEVVYMFGKFVLISTKSPLKYYSFDDIISLNKFVYEK